MHMIPLGVVHKLRWQDLGFFDHLSPFDDIFNGMNIDNKGDIFGPPTYFFLYT